MSINLAASLADVAKAICNVFKNYQYSKQITKEKYYQFVYISEIIKCKFKDNENDIRKSLNHKKGEIEYLFKDSPVYEKWKQNYLKEFYIDIESQEFKKISQKVIYILNKKPEIFLIKKKVCPFEKFCKYNIFKKISIGTLFNEIESILISKKDNTNAVSLYKLSSSNTIEEQNKAKKAEKEKQDIIKEYNELLLKKENKDLTPPEIRTIISMFEKVECPEVYGIPEEIIRTIQFFSKNNNQKRKFGETIKEVFEISMEKLKSKNNINKVFNIIVSYKNDGQAIKANTFKLLLEVLYENENKNDIFEKVVKKENIRKMILYFYDKHEKCNTDDYDKDIWLNNYKMLSRIIPHSVYCEFLKQNMI